MKRLKDFFAKLKILKMLLQGTCEEWKKQVWEMDLDGAYCCSGLDCGCGGMTVREIYTAEIKNDNV
jgi:hypothetical protein